MVPSLRNRFALAVFIGALLIPAVAGNLRGLTHVLVCEEPISQPFFVQILDGEATVGSSFVLDDEATSACGGISVDLRSALDGDRLDLEVILTNDTDLSWSGTVGLTVATAGVDAVIPARTGTVGPATTSSVTLTMNLDDGVTDIDGTLLLGP
ncbi:MAG: hypothetical protein HKN46_01295 [Acidimicrobiia bacterium]|nr:hypothetical protein [Acidimicrobiia bacterium]